MSENIVNIDNIILLIVYHANANNVPVDQEIVQSTIYFLQKKKTFKFIDNISGQFLDFNFRKIPITNKFRKVSLFYSSLVYFSIMNLMSLNFLDCRTTAHRCSNQITLTHKSTFLLTKDGNTIVDNLLKNRVYKKHYKKIKNLMRMLITIQYL